MTPDQDQPDRARPDQLDELVREALPASVDQLSVARLERFWREESRRRSRRPTWGLAAAAAALLAVAGWWTLRTPTPNEVVQHTEPTPPVVEVPQSERVGRAPTALEIVAFHAHSARKIDRPRLVIDLPEPTATEKVVALLRNNPAPSAEQIVAISPDVQSYKLLLAGLDRRDAANVLTELTVSGGERQRVLEAVREMDEPADDLLFVLLNDQDQVVRRWAAVQLGERNGPEIAGRLIAIVTKQNARHHEAWLALANCRGAVAQNFLTEASRQPHLLGYWNAARVSWSLP